MFINVHTYYSLRYGTLKPKDLLEQAQQLQIKCMALTDINTTSACLEFARLAPAHDIIPVLGVDFRNDAQQQFIMLAKNNKGFLEINRCLSQLLHTKQSVPHRAPTLPETVVIYPFHSFTGETLAPNEFLGVRARDLNRLAFSPWRNRLHKLVALHTVTFQNKKDFNTHRLLRAIDNNTI